MNLNTPTVHRLFTAAFFLLAFYFRASGLFHGLDERSVFHPDTPKQIQNLDEGLQNNHLNYYGNWFYDGYPYGLNRMDEAVIRVTRAVVLVPLYRLTSGQDHSLPLPSRWMLFYYTRILRLLYGMVTAVLLLAILKRLTGNPLVSICALALYAVSPLSVSVTHYASGDIGIDLFLAFALYFLTLHTRKPAHRYLFAAGVSVGFAFASKYQGALGAWIVAVYVLLLSFPPDKQRILRFLQRGTVSASGFFAGAFLFTPGFWYDPSTTWRLMRVNFENIKNYTVPEAFLELPRHTRIATGLTQNVPLVVASLGGVLVLAALISLLLALHSCRKDRKANPSPDAGILFWIASASFPFFTILISTAMKPMVHPYHFSFLVIPLILSAGMALHALHTPAKLRSALPAIGVTGLMCLQALPVTLREDRLWREPSIIPVYERYASHSTVRPQAIGRRFPSADPDVKTFYLHPGGLSVFRNRPREITNRHYRWWREHEQLPVPSRTLHDTVPGWIFLHGARFPNSDLLFRIPGGETHRIRLVHNQPPPDTLHLGIRSGSRPVFLRGTLGAANFAVDLPPHTQKLVKLHPGPAQRIFPAADEQPRTHIHELRLSARPGSAWIEVIHAPLQKSLFTAFGPDAGTAPPPPLDEEAASVLQTIRFLDSEEPVVILPPAHPLFTSEGLPAGNYQLRATLVNLSDQPAPFSFSLDDPLTPSPGFTAPELITPVLYAPPGISVHTRLFHKPFAPFEVELSLNTHARDLLLRSWSFAPVRDQTAPPQPDPPALPFHPLDIRYREGIRLTGLHLALPDNPHEPITWAVQAEIDETLSPKAYRETAVFIHLLRKDGSIFQTLDVPMEQTSIAPWVHLHTVLPEAGYGALEHLDIRIGLYIPRKRLRKQPDARPTRGPAPAVSRKAVYIPRKMLQKCIEHLCK